jgi:O-antigen ligase
VTQAVAEQIERLPVVGEIIPEGARSSESLYDRTVQLMTAIESVRADPWLGDGLGAGFEFESVTLGSVETVYIDNGWAYLFQKMGLVGAAAFIWLLITIFKGFSRESVGLTACLLSAALLTMFSEPVFFHFTTAPFLGAFAGLLLAKKDRLRQPAALSHQKVS